MKPITINGLTFERTPDRERRLLDAIIETERILGRLTAVPAALQDVDRVNFYKNHLTILQGALTND